MSRTLVKKSQTYLDFQITGLDTSLLKAKQDMYATLQNLQKACF